VVEEVEDEASSDVDTALRLEWDEPIHDASFAISADGKLSEKGAGDAADASGE
jgi:hypothetical protein